MRSYFLLFVCILIVSGCGSSTESVEGKLVVISNSSASLDAGGRWFEGVDTGVWYDADLSFMLKNTSSVQKDISYKLEIGVYLSGKFNASEGELFFDKDSVFYGASSTSIGGNISIIFNLKKLIGVGRKKSFFSSIPYGYRLTFFDDGVNDSLVVEGSFEGNSPENRFRGVIFTTEQSSDPLGLIDGPDNGDWDPLVDTTIRCFPLFPNPTNIGAELSYQTANELDTVVITLNKTRSFVIDTLFIFNDAKQPGQYSLSIKFPQLRHRMYRIFFFVKRKGIVISTHGDVMITE